MCTVGVCYKALHYSSVLSRNFPTLRFHTRLAQCEIEPWTQDTGCSFTFHLFTVQLFYCLQAHNLSNEAVVWLCSCTFHFNLQHYIALKHITLETMWLSSDTITLLIQFFSLIFHHITVQRFHCTRAINFC